MRVTVASSKSTAPPTESLWSGNSTVAIQMRIVNRPLAGTTAEQTERFTW